LDQVHIWSEVPEIIMGILGEINDLRGYVGHIPHYRQGVTQKTFVKISSLFRVERWAETGFGLPR
jgi:hypothetical protein